ncbi:MAG: hypothetical protein OEO23_13055 [Gemmatimonadota bacterium]|nr:hypothetical protein [Gemmatimonadota bacterium]
MTRAEEQRGPRRQPRGWATALVIPGFMLTGGCSSGPEGSPGSDALGSEASIEACPDGGVRLGPATDFADWEGSYALTLLSESGASGRGRLRLAAVDDSLARAPSVPGAASEPSAARAVLFGATDFDGAAVGAFSPGDLGSQDPRRPGVLVLQSQGADGTPSVILRLGAQVNDRDRTDFDGGHFALTVRWALSDSAFGGTWSSRGHGIRAAGRFCAVAEP